MRRGLDESTPHLAACYRDLVTHVRDPRTSPACKCTHLVVKTPTTPVCLAWEKKVGRQFRSSSPISECHFQRPLADVACDSQRKRHTLHSHQYATLNWGPLPLPVRRCWFWNQPPITRGEVEDLDVQSGMGFTLHKEGRDEGVRIISHHQPIRVHIYAFRSS